jgi:hypothetical protein
MEKGDLIKVTCDHSSEAMGYGIYLGIGSRGESINNFYEVFWKGRVATFDRSFWSFKILNTLVNNNENK